MDAESLARDLDKPRRAGKSWLACCPAHDDRNPSLTITDGDDGRTLVHCFSGCPQEAVIEALRARGLWPDATPQQKRSVARRERKQAVEHHRMVLEIARADMKNGRPVTPRMVAEIKQSLQFLREGGQ